MRRDTTWSRTIIIVLLGMMMVSTPVIGSVSTSVSDVSAVHQANANSEGSAGASPARARSGSSLNAHSVTECTTIGTPGRYVLTDNITEDAAPEDQPTCITVTSSDVVLDGEGHYIRGNVSTDGTENSVTGGVAILATGVHNITIRDVRLRSWKHGVRFENVTAGTVRITGFDYAGVSAVDSENVTVHDSRLRSATVDLGADNAVVRRNNINADPSGDAVRSAVRIRGDDGLVVDNVLNSAPDISFVGVGLFGNDSLVRDNLIIGKDPTRENPDPEAEGGGFNVSGDRNTLTNNAVNNTRYSFVYGDNNHIKGHTTRTFESGFGRGSSLAVSGNENVIRDSLLMGTSIYIDSRRFDSTASGNLVENVNLSGGSVGVRTSNNTISDVRAANSVDIGGVRNVSLTNSSANEVTIQRVENITAIDVSADEVSLSQVNNSTFRSDVVDGVAETAFEVFRSSHNVIEGPSNEMSGELRVKRSNFNSISDFTSSDDVRFGTSSHQTYSNITGERIRINAWKRSGNNSYTDLEAKGFMVRNPHNESFRGVSANYLAIDDVEDSSFDDVRVARISMQKSDRNSFRNVTIPEIRVGISMQNSDRNSFRDVTTSDIRLEDSEFTIFNGVTANNVTLRSISDNNTITRSTVDRISIVDDSRNNTLRNNTAAFRIAGRTSFDNRIVGNDVTGSGVGIELDRARRTVVRDNTVRETTRGIVLDGARDNLLTNNTVVRTGGPAYLSRNDSVNNTVRNLTLGPTVSFRSRDIALSTEPSPPDTPAGLSDVDVFLDATNTSADSWLNLTTRYTDADAGNVEEDTLRFWRYRRSWAEVPGFNRVKPADNVVEANVSGDSFGVLAPLGNGTGTAAPTITDYDARATDDDTLAVEFDSSEQLSDVLVVVTNTSGDEVARLTESEFAASGTDPITYTGAVDLPNGTYTATLETATDADGNDGATGQSATVTIGRVSVQLSLAANRTAVDTGGTVAFTVTRSDTGERVNATLFAGSRSVETGSDGQATLSFADTGTVEVTATKVATATETFRNDSVEIDVRSAAAEPSRIVAIPSNGTVLAGESFRLAVTYNASAAAEVYGVQFTLAYNTSLLNATDVAKGPYLGPEGDTLVLDNSTDDEAGRVDYGESRRTDGGVSGNGTVAYVEFRATERLSERSTRTDLSFVEIKASDPDGRSLATDRENGSIRIERNRPPTLSASPVFTVDNVGSPIVIDVRATDDTAVRSVRLLAPNGSEVDTLSCNGSGCDGTLSDTPTASSWNETAGAYEPVTYRVVATDDAGATTTATVRTEVYIAGDGNGDGVVDISDAVEIGRSWTCTVDESCYSDAGDLNNDGVVDIFDAVLVGRNWQATASSTTI